MWATTFWTFPVRTDCDLAITTEWPERGLEPCYLRIPGADIAQALTRVQTVFT